MILSSDKQRFRSSLDPFVPPPPTCDMPLQMQLMRNSKEEDILVKISSGDVGWTRPLSPPRTSPPRSRLSVCAYAMLACAQSAALGVVLQGVADALPVHAFDSARAGVEMAVIYAVTASTYLCGDYLEGPQIV